MQNTVEETEKQKKVVEQVSINHVFFLHTSLAKLMFSLLKQLSVWFIIQNISPSVV